MKVSDLEGSLIIETNVYEELPIHVAAFCSYLVQKDRARLDGCASLSEDDQSYQAIAAAGYALARDIRGDQLLATFEGAMKHLSGRTFFAEGRTPRFEIDSIALLGVALGASAVDIPKGDIRWLDELLLRSSRALKADEWQSDLVEIARGVIDPNYEISIKDVRICTAFLEAPSEQEQQAGWGEMIARLGDRDAVQIATNRAVFDRCAASLAGLRIVGAGVAGLISILEGLARSMSRWTYEKSPRVKGVTPQQWEIDHEYHVQNLVWTVLRPTFSDLVDEESLPKVGHKTPRYDLGVPSLETIVEVKFMRNAGPAACRRVVEEIAADCSLYLGPTTRYSKLIAFIWDECRQTEEYQMLKDGLESMEGIEKVVILSRPSRMNRETAQEL